MLENPVLVLCLVECVLLHPHLLLQGDLQFALAGLVLLARLLVHQLRLVILLLVGVLILIAGLLLLAVRTIFWICLFVVHRSHTRL
jgi:hypothetical protein